jgi:drug/metabolite transporter (DMT)-like permease
MVRSMAGLMVAVTNRLCIVAWNLSRHPLWKAYVAMASVCFFWGTTYLAIRMALESFSTLALVATRFLLSGVVMVAAARWRGMELPRGRELVVTCLTGVLILGVGNGCLTWAEELIPSSLAALFIAVSPFWLVGAEALIPGGDKLRAPAVVGMLIGFAGASLLFVPDLLAHGFGGNAWKGFLILQGASISWGFGSIIQRRYPTRAHSIVNGAVQQVAAGLVFLVPAMVEAREIHWSARGAGALVYLAIFGSIVGYSSYVYALDRLPVALVSIYTYINPLVAAALGWMFYREPFGWKETSALGVIFLGVAVVKRFTPSRAPSPPPPPRSSESW